MSRNSKVVWSEGLFLRPQHFQQQDRHIETIARSRMTYLRAYSWGFTRLEVDHGMMKSGKIALLSAQGIMPDGTPFSIPEDAELPLPVDLDENVRDCLFYLALPLQQPGSVEVDRRDGREAGARMVSKQIEVFDNAHGAQTVADIDIAQLRFRLLSETTDAGGYTCLGVVRVTEVRADGHVVIDNDYMPTSLDCFVVRQLRAFMTELLGALHQRREALISHLARSDFGTTAEISDFLMLQVINRYHPLLNHIAQTPNLHPESLYRLCVEMVGEFATLTNAERRVPSLPPYRHDDLASSFYTLIAALRQGLSTVLEQRAVLIPLQEQSYGIRVGMIADRELLTAATFVFGCRTDQSAEDLHRDLPGRAKICSVERIRELVNLSLSGIGLRPLQNVPREIPYNPRTAYFELDINNELWPELSHSGAIAVHVSGDVAGLEFSLWAVRDEVN